MLSNLLSEISKTAPSTPIKEAEAKNMPYLQAIIKEGLRLWPPVTGLMSKTAPPGGDTFNDVFIPGGTDVGYSAWGVFRNKKFWGQDATEFNPERWFGNEPQRLKEMDDTMALIFGYGKYGCLGKGVAMVELNKIFVEVSRACLLYMSIFSPLQLLRRFDFTIIDPTNPWKCLNFGVSLQRIVTLLGKIINQL